MNDTDGTDEPIILNLKKKIYHYGRDLYKILRERTCRTDYFIFNGKGDTSKFVSLLLKSLENMHNDGCVIASCAQTGLVNSVLGAPPPPLLDPRTAGPCP